MAVAALALAALVLASPGMAGAQQAEESPAAADSARYVLPPVTVSVEREHAAAPPVTSLSVDPEQVRRTQAENPYDLVRRVAGLEVHDQGQGPGYASNVVVRGFTSDHSADVLLTVDGVPVNWPVSGHAEGYADWNLFPAAAVSSMRVLYGPASPLHGDFALGGVVEVFTAADAEGAEASLSGSSERDVEGWFRAGGRGGSGGAFTALALEREQGWRDNAEQWLANAVLRGWRRAGEGRLEGGLLLYGSDWRSPGFVSLQRYNEEDLTGAVDPTDGGSAARAILHGRWSRPVGAEGALEATAWTQASRLRVFLNVPGEDIQGQSGEEDDRFGVGGDARVSWDSRAGEITLGLTGRTDVVEYDLFETEARREVADEVAYDARFASGSVYARWRSRLGGRLGLDAGGRLDALRYESRDRLTPGEDWADATTAVVSPKLGLRYPFTPALAAYGSASRGFRGAPGVIGDPRRPPFLAWATEAGIEIQRPAWNLRAGAFRVHVTNERIQDPVTRQISTAGSSVRRGLDLEGGVRGPGGWSLGGAITLNDATITGREGATGEDSGAAVSLASSGRGRSGAFRLAHEETLRPGERVPAVARYAGRVELQGPLPGRATARAAWRFSGPYVPIGEPDVRTRAYGVLDFAASLPGPGAGTTLDVELQNALDQKYPEIRASGFINPGAPRTLRAALRLEL